MANEKNKTDCIHFRVTPEMKKRIMKRADFENLSVSAYLLNLFSRDTKFDFNDPS